MDREDWEDEERRAAMYDEIEEKERMQQWPRRGVHWDVFDGCEVQVIDEPPADTPESAWEDAALWPDGPRFEYDDQAAGFVLATAGSPPEDAPDEVVTECRAAVREIVASWDVEGGVS